MQIEGTTHSNTTLNSSDMHFWEKRVVHSVSVKYVENSVTSMCSPSLKRCKDESEQRNIATANINIATTYHRHLILYNHHHNTSPSSKFLKSLKNLRILLCYRVQQCATFQQPWFQKYFSHIVVNHEPNQPAKNLNFIWSKKTFENRTKVGKWGKEYNPMK